MAASSKPPRVVVVGAGPAGLYAARTLASAGLQPVLVNEAPEPGGQIYRRPPPEIRGALSDAQLYGADAARAAALHDGFDLLKGQVDHRANTMIWNAVQTPDGFRLSLHTSNGERSIVDCDAVILATGAMDRILPMPGWTSPGVWSLGGAQVVLKGQANLVGQRPVFAGSGPLLYLVAWQYAKAGAIPAAVIDASTFGAKVRAAPAMAARPAILWRGLAMLAALHARGVPIREGSHAERIESTEEGLRVDWSGPRGGGQVLGDAVVIGHGLKPEQQLAELLGCRSSYDHGARQYLVETNAEGRTTVPFVYLAGDMAGIRGGHAAQFAGELAALALLEDLQRGNYARRRTALSRSLLAQNRFRTGLEQAFPFPEERVASLPDDTVVCRCENISAGDLRRAIALWKPTDVNRLKAMTRCGMGRCQGRLCGGVAASLLAAESGQAVGDVGCLRAQVPIKPLPAPVYPPRSFTHEPAQ
ncbi:MAG: FAD-dependent oxidoreductase [Cypionkella sp.]